jgi:hypothetical protein
VQTFTSVQTTVSGPNQSSSPSTEGVITQIDSTHGYFYLNQGDSVLLTTSPNNLTFSAQIFTNGTSPTSTVWPDSSQCITNVSSSNQPIQGVGVGATFAEFTLNGDPTYIFPDTVDISEVNGVNARYKITLPTIPPHAGTTNYPNFFCCSSYLFAHHSDTQWGKFSKGQYIPVQSIENRPGLVFPYTSDSTSVLVPISPAIARVNGATYAHGTVGVYPFGCDLCTSSSVPGCTPSSLYGSNYPQRKTICQLSRPIPNLGGTVTIQLKAFPYPPAATHRR